MYFTLWLDRRCRKRSLRRSRTGSVSSYRSGALREGTGGAGTCLPPGPTALSTEADTPKGRSGSWLAADQLAGSDGGDGDHATAALGAARSRERGVQLRLSVYVGHRRFGRLDPAVD